MKLFDKKIRLAVICAAIMVSCTDNEIEEVNTASSSFIGLVSTTTRASVADLSTIQTNSDGFKVYATGGENPTGWYADEDGHRIDGTNNHKYANNRWGFAQSVKWPDHTTDYPMNFYAIYPASPKGFGSMTFLFNPFFYLSSTYEVPDAGNQEDILFAKANTSVRPATGNLSLVFTHILSKVNFGIIAGTGTVPYIQSLELINSSSRRAFDFIDGIWFGTPAIHKSFRYFGDVPSGNIMPVFTPTVRDESTANAIYPGTHGNNLMLLPQISPSWQPQSGTAPTSSSGGYISVIYRMSTGNGTSGVGTLREVGFEDATQHPDNINGMVTGPLFVKAGFPLPADDGNFTWDKGRSYMYNLVLGAHGSCNGYILDEYYYDEKGVQTALKLVEVRNEGKRVGDKLQAGVIHVILDVDDWGLQSGGDVRPNIITVEPRNMVLRYNQQLPAERTLHVNCLKGDGSPHPTAAWTLSVPTTQTWVKLSLMQNASFATASTTVAGTGNQTVYVYVEENTTNAMRSTEYFLNGVKAGHIYQSCNYDAFPDINTTPVGFLTYVGAFWRANQTGERIISIEAGANSSNYGDWTASVVWMDPRWGYRDGIMLSRDKLPGTTGADPNIYTNSPGDAENYKVESDSMTVSGTLSSTNRRIIFRIGLKSNYTPTSGHPARFAVILLTYAGNTKNQNIYLRQGEEASYLFCNTGTIVGTNDITVRTETNRFAAYNLRPITRTLLWIYRKPYRQ